MDRSASLSRHHEADLQSSLCLFLSLTLITYNPYLLKLLLDLSLEAKDKVEGGIILTELVLNPLQSGGSGTMSAKNCYHQ
jgi:hypothetical protein